MLVRPAKLSTQAQVDSVKSMMVERVSNADRAGYALRAFPNAHQTKRPDNYNLSSEKEDREWPKSEYRSDALDLIGQKDLLTLATIGKNSCR